MSDQPETGDEPQAAEGVEAQTVENVNGEVIDEALPNAWVVGVQYVNPGDPDGPEGPLGDEPADEG